MDKRTQNRLREHSGEGHKLTRIDNPNGRPGEALHECECGWLGWLTTDIR